MHTEYTDTGRHTHSTDAWIHTHTDSMDTGVVLTLQGWWRHQLRMEGPSLGLVAGGYTAADV